MAALEGPPSTMTALLHRDECDWPFARAKFIAAKVLNTPRGAAAGL
jgi:hypothetical protein